MIVKSLFAILLSLCFIVPVRAQAVSNKYEQMTKNYIQSISKNDQNAVNQAWLAIYSDPGAEKYLTANYPMAAHSYRMMGMAMKMSKELAAYRKKYPQGSVLEGKEGIVPTKMIPILATNGETALANPNEDRMTVNEEAAIRANIPLIDNAKAAAKSPNQNQISNQQAIANRVNR